jgi:uncharacterized coiled-coil DUF342 family protein
MDTNINIIEHINNLSKKSLKNELRKYIIMYKDMMTFNYNNNLFIKNLFDEQLKKEDYLKDEIKKLKNEIKNLKDEIKKLKNKILELKNIIKTLLSNKQVINNNSTNNNYNDLYALLNYLLNQIKIIEQKINYFI